MKLNSVTSVLILCGLGLSSNLSANGCEQLMVTIQNKTSNTCVLSHYALNAGVFDHVSTLPAFISSGQSSKPLVINQKISGPELEMVYGCGADNMVHFVSKQSVCFFKAGVISR